MKFMEKISSIFTFESPSCLTGSKVKPVKIGTWVIDRSTRRLALNRRDVFSRTNASAPDLPDASRDRPAPVGLLEWLMSLNTSMPVLVVDDYQTMIRIIRNLLKQLGFEDVDDALDGEEAIRKMRERRYGLVISDWNMEPMTGFDLLKSVRSDDHLRDVPFIMITAESKTDNVVAAKKAGVSNYIVKPFNAQTLKSKIEAVLG